MATMIVEHPPMAEFPPPRRPRAAPLTDRLTQFLEGPGALALRALLVMGTTAAALAALGLIRP